MMNCFDLNPGYRDPRNGLTRWSFFTLTLLWFGLSIQVQFQFVTRLCAEFSRFSRIQLQNVLGRTFTGIVGATWGATRRGVFRHADQGKLLVEIEDVQWNLRVFHPEGSSRFARKQKQHAVIVWHAFPKHQAQLLLVCGLGQLNRERLAFEIDVRILRNAGAAQKQSAQ
jgi:hypothetical protein